MAPERERRLVLMEARMARRRPASGTARYIRELRAATARLDPPDLRVRWLGGPPGLPRRGRLTGAVNALLDVAWMHAAVPLAALVLRADAVHGTFDWLPARCPVPVSVTIMDLAWEHAPEEVDPRFRRFASRFTRLAARRARVVVVPSRATGDDLTARYGVPAERIRVVPLGVRMPDELEVPREPFVLAVGASEPRKRVRELIAAHARYLAAAPPDPPPCRLVVAGDLGALDPVLRAAAGPGYELLGRVGEAELADLYRRATLMVYPSSLEGFGLPILEAMAHGCPVLTSRASSLPEAGGDAALYLDDAAPGPFAARLAEVLADRAALAERGRRSRAHAAAFTWERAARGTLDAIREALGS